MSRYGSISATLPQRIIASHYTKAGGGAFQTITSLQSTGDLFKNRPPLVDAPYGN